MKRFSTNATKEIFETLRANAYSPLWLLVDDFQCNGHTIRVKDSSLFLSVIIDNCYQRIGGNCTIVANGVTYSDPLDYVMTLINN